MPRGVPKYPTTVAEVLARYGYLNWFARGDLHETTHTVARAILARGPHDSPYEAGPDTALLLFRLVERIEELERSVAEPTPGGHPG